ncbi:hypothetical protein IP88_00285 [alpha proteobacterium AAP81b]|nr:hypothetical protein IP88_00285 [alpha proteobacterium AAP81b]
MVRRSNHDNIARKLVELLEEERYDTLDFASFMRVTALFADRIELVEEQDAWLRSDIIEKAAQASVSFPEITAD